MKWPCQQAMLTETPNPSVKGTCLRQAPYVKRWAT